MITNSLHYGYASVSDSKCIAKFMIEASGGIIDFLFSKSSENDYPQTYIEKLVSLVDSPISFNHTYVCKKGNNLVGAITSYFGSRFMPPDRSKAVIPDDIYECLRPYYEIDISNSYYLDSLFVCSEYRGNGIATVLLEHGIEVAKEKGFKYVSLYVWEANRAAVGLYKKLGFYTKKRIHANPHNEYKPGARLLMYKVL